MRGEVTYFDASGSVNTVLNAFDPRTGNSYSLAPFPLGPALAIVPGATWCDPWEPMVPPTPGPCWTMDPPSGGPPEGDGDATDGDVSGGDAGDVGSTGAKHSGDCAGGGADPGLILAFFALLALGVAGRRRGAGGGLGNRQLS